jgi:hypothetical protein
MKQGSRNQQLVAVIALLFVGLVGVWGMGQAAFANYRSVDMLRLIAAGACFGAAIVIMLQYFRGVRAGGA